MYAIVEVQGKQYKAVEGETIKVDKINLTEGETFELSNVMLFSSESGIKVGAPFLEGAKIEVSLKQSLRDRKIRVVKFKRRKGYERSHGHRQDYSLLTINKISAN